MKRSCDGCTACCKTHGVFEIKKMPGEWCPHCKVGVGCGIYSTRPKGCADFKCSWLMGIDGSGPQHRPDIIKIVPEYREITGIGTGMWFWELEAGALSSELARNWSRRNLIAGNCVMHVALDGNHKLYLSAKVDGAGLGFFALGRPEARITVVGFLESLASF